MKSIKNYFKPGSKESLVEETNDRVNVIENTILTEENQTTSSTYIGKKQRRNISKCWLS